MPNGQRIGILLNTTAPAMTLMSGAMLAFAEEGVEFDTISTTGAGGLIGLLYLAPNGKSRVEALKEVPNLFVSDWLYKVCPVNFKLFHKNNLFAETFFRARKHLPSFDVKPEESAHLKRFINDWLQLWATALTPTTSQFLRKGLMGHVPLVTDLVDFDALRAQPTNFYINTFSLWNRRLRVFDQSEVDTNIFNAAQAMYMLFEPVHAAHDLLITGATRDPTGLQAIGTRRRDLEKPPLTAILALDPIPDAFWRTPENAWDAFQLMLMNPIAAIQELILSLYGWTEWNVNQKNLAAMTPLYRIPMDEEIKEEYYPRMLDWTHANAVKLQEIGRRAAAPIARLLRPAAPVGVGGIAGGSNGHLEDYRYRRVVEREMDPATREFRITQRANQFLSLYKPMINNIDRFYPPGPDKQPVSAKSSPPPKTPPAPASRKSPSPPSRRSPRPSGPPSPPPSRRARRRPESRGETR
jgi:NTE family protein